ncbi:MAG: hypothetical protein ACI932_000970 [Paracoccaceae bacterium]|jgi:hypothetical protein
MIIQSIRHLSSFIRDWYDSDDLGLFDLPARDISGIAIPLVQVWRDLGKLSLAYEGKFHGSCDGPLARQDRLAPPGKLVRRAGCIVFAHENQGGWCFGYRENESTNNPTVYHVELSRFDRKWISSPLSINLNQFLIDFVLRETVLFNSTNFLLEDGEVAQIYESCNVPIFTSSQVHATWLETSEARFRTDSKRSRLVMENDAPEDSFIGSAEKARGWWLENCKNYS